MKVNSKTIENAIDSIESSKQYIDLVTEDLKKINLPSEMSDLQIKLNNKIKEMESYNEYEKELVKEFNTFLINVENIEKSVKSYLGNQDDTLFDKMIEENKIINSNMYDKNITDVYNREIPENIKYLLAQGLLTEEDIKKYQELDADQEELQKFAKQIADYNENFKLLKYVYLTTYGEFSFIDACLSNGVDFYTKDYQELSDNTDYSEGYINELKNNNYCYKIYQKMNEKVKEFYEVNDISTQYNKIKNEYVIDDNYVINTLNELGIEINSIDELKNYNIDSMNYNFSANISSSQAIEELAKIKICTDCLFEIEINKKREEIANKIMNHPENTSKIYLNAEENLFNQFEYYINESYKDMYAAYLLKESRKQIPYQLISQKDDFINYDGYEKYLSNSYEYNDVLNDEDFNYMSKEQIKMYLYLREKDSKKASDDYKTAIIDKINNAKGYEKAKIRYAAIGEEEISDYLRESTNGFGEGVVDFCLGIKDVIAADGIKEDRDYELLYFTKMLSDNNKNILNGTYQISRSVGEAAPTVAATMITTAIATPAAGAATADLLSSVVGTSLVALSSTGSGIEYSLQNGNDELSSYGYGIAVGLSDALLEVGLSRIPFMKKLDEGKIYQKMIKKGITNTAETTVKDIASEIILKEKVTDEYLYDISESFIAGMISSGVMNGGKFIIESMGNKIKIDTIKLKRILNKNGYEKAREYIEEEINKQYSTKDTLWSSKIRKTGIKNVKINLSDCFEEGIDNMSGAIVGSAKDEIDNLNFEVMNYVDISNPIETASRPDENNNIMQEDNETIIEIQNNTNQSMNHINNLYEQLNNDEKK